MSGKAPHPPTLPEGAEDFLRNRTVHTQRTYRFGLRRLQAFAQAAGYTKRGVPLAPGALDRKFLVRYLAWLRKKGSARGEAYQPDTLSSYLTTARRYLEWLDGEDRLPPAVSAQGLEAALAHHMDTTGLKLPRNRRSADDTIGALLNYYRTELAKLPDAEPEDARAAWRLRQQRLILLRDQALLQVLYATAGRAAEVAQLTRADVNDGAADFAEIVGKGNKPRKLVFTAPAQQAIQAYLTARGQDGAAGLFISHGRADGQPLTPSTLWTIVNRAACAVFDTNNQGQPLTRVGPHSFRHLRAQHLVNEGMALDTLQAMLGHASIATTRDIYAPDTPIEKLLDEVATYGRSPEAVADAGEQKLSQQKRAARNAAPPGTDQTGAAPVEEKA